MASTNKTANYELSQFVATDKPAWLQDYNTDMNKIDTGIKGAADTATSANGKANTANTNIGDMTYLSTTAKNTIVAAINEVDAKSETAQTVANDAATTATSAFELASQSVGTNKISDGAVTFPKLDSATVGLSFGNVLNGTNCTYRVGKIGKIGLVQFSTTNTVYSGEYTSKSITIPSGTLPDGSVITFVSLQCSNQTATSKQSPMHLGNLPMTVNGAVQINMDIYTDGANQKSCIVNGLLVVVLP